MADRYDIRLTTAYINANNDIEWYISDNHHIKSIISAHKGEYKETPTLGVGISSYVGATTSTDDLKRDVMLNLQSDNYRCDNPLITLDYSGNLKIDPNL